MDLGANVLHVSNERKPYHHGNLYEELLTIAVRLGREEGPQAVTIRQVTREAGVSPTSAYRHFKDQHALMLAVSGVAIESLMKRIFAAVNTSPEEATAGERIMRCGWAYFNFALEEPKFFRCLCTPGRILMPMTFGDFQDTLDNFPIPVRESQQDVLNNTFLTITQFALEKDGDFKLDTLAPNILAAWSTVHGFTTLVIDGFVTFENAEQRSQTAAMVFGNALRGLSFTDPANVSDLTQNKDVDLFQVLDTIGSELEEAGVSLEQIAADASENS